MNKEALRVKRACKASQYHYRAGCACQGTGLVDADVDTTGASYMAGATTLPELIARLATVMEHEAKDLAAAILAGDREVAIICAARRSGMAECRAALEHYQWQTLPRPRCVRGFVG